MPKPYPFQDVAARWLAERDRACLFDDQGLGKTISAIRGAALRGARSVLVVCPSVVLWNWQREFSDWFWNTTIYWSVLSKTSSRALRAPVDSGVEAVFVTHGLILHDSIRSQLLARDWDVVILDESHFFRSRTAKRTRVFFGRPDDPIYPSIIDRARACWLLTGTPMPNDCSELWAPFASMFPDRMRNSLGRVLSFDEFRARYCVTQWIPYGDGVKVVGNKNAAELRERVGFGTSSGVVLRRLKADVLPDLPPCRYEQVTLRPPTLPAALAQLDRDLSPRMRQWVVGVDDSADLFEALRDEEFARYRRLCGLAKIKPTAELLRQELEFGALRKVVVFAHHTDVILGLMNELADFLPVSITGANTAKQRAAAVDAFQKRTAVRVFVGQIVAAGTGITLTAASDVVFAELSFVPGENAQAADRINRIGQTADSLRVRAVALAGTVDELVVPALQRKTRMIREVLADQEKPRR